MGRAVQPLTGASVKQKSQNPRLEGTSGAPPVQAPKQFPVAAAQEGIWVGLDLCREDSPTPLGSYGRLCCTHSTTFPSSCSEGNSLGSGLCLVPLVLLMGQHGTEPSPLLTIPPSRYPSAPSPGCENTNPGHEHSTPTCCGSRMGHQLTSNDLQSEGGISRAHTEQLPSHYCHTESDKQRGAGEQRRSGLIKPFSANGKCVFILAAVPLHGAPRSYLNPHLHREAVFNSHQQKHFSALQAFWLQTRDFWSKLVPARSSGQT